MSPSVAMSGSIEPDIDIYGPRARASALADYLEVAALRGRRITQAALEDLIVDNEWVNRPRRQFYLPEVEEDPTTWGDAVFNLIAEREQHLGAAYPFELQSRALVLKDPSLDPLQSSYIALLALTVAHAWKLVSTVAPEPTLEAIVASVLASKGIAAVNIGATDRGTGFVAAVRAGGLALGLRPADDPRPRSRWAKDEGVDTLAGFVWRDSRPGGQWLLIGQVTVTESQNWKTKLKEPEPAKWARYMREPLHPQVFLAVPHHAEEEHVRELLTGQLGMVVDRLRLVPAKPANTPAEVALIEALQAAVVS